MQVLNSTPWAHMLVQCSSLDSRHTKRSVQVTATEASARGGGDVAIHQGRTEKTVQKDSNGFKQHLWRPLLRCTLVARPRKDLLPSCRFGISKQAPTKFTRRLWRRCLTNLKRKYLQAPERLYLSGQILDDHLKPHLEVSFSSTCGNTVLSQYNCLIATCAEAEPRLHEASWPL